MGGRLLNSYQKAMMERRKIIEEKQEIEHQRELKHEERRKALEKFEKDRKRRKKILSMKNKRGQPNLNAQIGLLLDKIKNNQRKAKQKQLNDSHIEQSQLQNNDKHQLSYDNDDSDAESHGFLEE
eukprot:UN11430